ncbi:DnaJ domain-containing protein [Rhizobiales bacterium RZME27]|jgi:curved DNA-binding protein CbpA|uniref:DnaJ domain-containing protein n=1 Tax=Endobacterium cereale TaxID=2663029 RepID=A0A6A8A7M7_9HYPH|nr:J domain-containing protein [Endobacterium cereale]MEB2844919.1 J domain-containing protein [Endobacterium cereale]MQY44831.1 DnaJ domain-containing protein [Endobacterium cereale]
MIDPYDILGVTRDADGTAIKGAYRKQAKTSHPDAGGDVETFSKLTNSYELLIDPIRRKVYDDTGYDPALADTKDLESVLVLETLMNELILDEREPGSFDPVAAMRRKLTDQIVSARFHILEMERHRGRIRNHLDRIGKRPEADILGRMFRARTDTIGEAITKSEAQIDSIERAYAMLEGYSYEMVEIVQNAAE